MSDDQGTAANPSAIAQQIAHFAAIEFENNAQITAFCKQGVSLYRALYMHQLFAAEELKARLAKAPGAPGAMGVDSRIRAGRVAIHLARSADFAMQSGIAIVKTRAAFEKHFAAELDHFGARTRTRKPSFDWVPE